MLINANNLSPILKTTTNFTKLFLKIKKWTKINVQFSNSKKLFCKNNVL